jgi:hypothetical protein
MGEVFLHVGLPKTGTTTIQAALDASVASLAAEGVLVAGGSHRVQRLAVYDLLGQRVPGEQRGVVAGSLRRLLDETAAYPGRSVVLSEEELALARPRHVRRLVRGLGGRPAVVVIGVRDLARTLVSAWQQSVVNGSTTRWGEFVGSARGEAAAPPSEGVSFWLRHDLLRVVDAWSTAVPVERIRLVTVPPPGAPSGTLLTRFAAAAELPAGAWAGPATPSRNVSLGAAELEAVRRLNAAVRGRLNASQHRFVVEAGIRSRLAGAGGRPLLLPDEHLAWAREYGERLAEEVRRRGLTVIGSLSDLVPGPSTSGGPPPDAVDEATLLEATEAALASLALDHGRLFRRFRHTFFEREGRWPGAAEVLGSQARAGSFRLRKWALFHADHDPAMARAVRAYLERTSPSRIRP